jgi:hypothetical protein
MKISKTHQEFADYLNNKRTIDHPDEFLGPNWKDVLNFWIFIDTLNEEQWNSIKEQYWALDTEDNLNDYYWKTRDYAIEATDQDVVDAAHFSMSYYITGYFCAIDVTYELIGSHILQEQGKSLIFLPMFLNV